MDPRLYLGSSRTLCSILNETPETVDTLLLIAHMPGVQDVSMELASVNSVEEAVISMAENWPPADWPCSASAACGRSLITATPIFWIFTALRCEQG